MAGDLIMIVKRTFSRHGQLFREGTSIPEGMLPESVIPLLIAEGWIGEAESIEETQAEVKHEEPVQPKKAAKRRKK